MSSISTNRGPQESKSLTELFSDGPSSGPSRLPLAAGSLTQTISVKAKERLLRKLCYPKLVSKIEKAGFKYELSMEDISYTNLENNAVPASRTSTITTVVRQVHKGLEYLVWYTIERGFDKNGNEVIGSGLFLQHGIDKDVEIRPIRNSEGEITKLQLGNIYTDILTQPFVKEELEQLLNNSELDEHIQYSFTNNLGKSYGGFSAEEMINCSAKELTARGQLGHAGDDLSVIYSDLSSKDLLYLQNQAPK